MEQKFANQLAQRCMDGAGGMDTALIVTVAFVETFSGLTMATVDAFERNLQRELDTVPPGAPSIDEQYLSTVLRFYEHHRERARGERHTEDECRALALERAIEEARYVLGELRK